MLVGPGRAFCMCALIPGAADRSQWVCDDDLVRLYTQGRSLDLLVEPRELEARRAAWRPSEPHYAGGYGELFSQHVAQTEEGCDFDFLAAPALRSIQRFSRWLLLFLAIRMTDVLSLVAPE